MDGTANFVGGRHRGFQCDPFLRVERDGEQTGSLRLPAIFCDPIRDRFAVGYGWGRTYRRYGNFVGGRH